MTMNMLAVFAGGGLGALLRYLITMAVYGEDAPSFPYGTLAVNVLGCFVLGLVAAFFLKQPGWPMVVKLFVITGILGGLTTFSTFTLETFNLLCTEPVYGVLNLAVSLAGGLMVLAGGMALGTRLF